MDILQIPLDRPDLLFTGKDEADKALYRKLAHQWHPDRQDGKGEVFQQIAALYRERQVQLDNGTWQGSGFTEYVTEAKPRRTFRINYLRQHPFELGICYICRDTVMYVVEAKHRVLYENALQAFKSFKYANDKMKAEIGRYLPTIVHEEKLSGSYMMAVSKPPDFVSVADLAAHVKRIPNVHIAWIISRLMNLSCYLQYTNIAHGDINQETLFVSPSTHSGMLLGGWWYARQRGASLSYLPQHSAKIWRTLPHAVQSKKQATSKLDHELIRAMARELLGDAGGTSLLRNPEIPKPLALWLNATGTGSAVTDFGAWAKVRESSLGERRFTKFDIAASDIYKGLN
jgi:hypothetical protein